MIFADSFEVESDAVLAPIAGYTDSPFRRIARKHGAGFTVTELISAEGLVRRNEKTMKMLEFSLDEQPIGIQLFGRDPAVIAEAARIAEQMGPAFIDINMGCPATSVVKGGKGGGASLMLEPELAGTIVREVRDSVKLPVSAKIRTGWNSSEGSWEPLVRELCKSGVSFITVHGRTKVQGYSGRADWEVISQVCGVSTVPVIGNGDVLSLEEAAERKDRSGCALVMIGRAACGNPWVFSGRKPTITEICGQMREHLAMNMEFYGDYGHVLMRKHMGRYIHGVRGASSVRNALVTAHGPAEILDILKRLEDEA